MSRRPSGKRWQLTVRDGSLALVAPHGMFRVRGMTPEVERALAHLPEDADLECEGDYEGPGNIESLIVTEIVREVSPMVPFVGDRPDDVVHASAELSRARAAERLGVGDVDGAAADLAYAMDGDTPGIAAVYGVLPEAQRAALLDRYEAWAARQRAPRWEEVRWLPLDRFSHAHLEAAATTAFERGGRFGAHTVEQLVAEIERRGTPVDALAKRVTKLRRAQATEGGVTIQIHGPREAQVVGATRDFVYVYARVPSVPAPIVRPGDLRQLVGITTPVVIKYDAEGVELARYPNIRADLVVDDVALQTTIAYGGAMPALRRLDGTVVAQFTDSVYHYDSELVCARGADADEVRVFSTGELVARWPRTTTLRAWWDDTTIHVEADQRRTYPRPPRRTEPWFFEQRGNRYALGPSQAEVVELEFTPVTSFPKLVPPWLAVHRADRLVLIALAELMTCNRIRVEGKQIAKRV